MALLVPVALVSGVALAPSAALPTNAHAYSCVARHRRVARIACRSAGDERVNGTKNSVRERLQRWREESVTAAYDFTRSTRDFYHDPGAACVGRYCSIREQLDDEYHGRYCEERQLLHDRLLDDVLCQVEGGKEEPWIVFTAGAMGSGKSRTFSWLVERGIVPLPEVLILDPDMFKGSLPEWRGYLERDRLSAGLHTRRESGYLVEVAQEAALRDRKHVWIDGSLRDGEWYEGVFRSIAARHPPYQIAILHVVADREAILRRVASRAQITGRHVPVSEIDDSVARVPRAVAALSRLAHFVAVVDNSADGTPRLVRYCDREQCHEGRDDWDQISDRLAGRDGGGPGARGGRAPRLPWERVAKNFEMSRRRRTAQRAADAEWG